MLSFLLPPACPLCTEPVERQGQLCAPCFTSVGFVTEPCCDRCGLPQPSEGAGRLCTACRAQPPAWAQARAAVLYEGGGRALILRLKHAHGQNNAAVLAPHMARAGARLLERAQVLVPVPLHRWRLARRGFNQAALLARALARPRALPLCLDALVRRRRTPPLGGLDAAGRARVMADAIGLRPGRSRLIAGRRVLLIDDVLTSGATANACARALLDGGASSVDVLVATRVPNPRDS